MRKGEPRADAEPPPARGNLKSRREPPIESGKAICAEAVRGALAACASAARSCSRLAIWLQSREGKGSMNFPFGGRLIRWDGREEPPDIGLPEDDLLQGPPA
eukprot:5379050-Alexandrium_andersonii.AAC.1